jgi:hypothetical protein
MMKTMRSKDESKMKSSIRFGDIFGRRNEVQNGSVSSDSLHEANEFDHIAARAKQEALNAFGRELDDAQASHTAGSKNQTGMAEEKVKDLEAELSEFRAVATSHLTRLIEEANRHQTRRIAAVVQDYDQRFSEMQRLSENVLVDATAAVAQKDAELSALTAESEARNVELAIQLKRAEEAHENATKAEQESIARTNDLEKQLEDLRANMAAEMERKAEELIAVKIAYDNTVKELEQQASEMMLTETAETMNHQIAREADVNVTQRIAAMADAQVQLEHALVAAQTELMQTKEDLAALRIDYDQLNQHPDQQQPPPLKLAPEYASDTALEIVLRLQNECESSLAETLTKMDEVTREADKRLSQRITEVEKEYAQRLFDAQERTGQSLLDAKHDLAMKEEGLTVLQAQYEEERTNCLTPLQRVVAERDAAVEAEHQATTTMKKLEHASQVRLTETTTKLEQRIYEIRANATQRINVLMDERETSERGLAAARDDLLEKEAVIAALKMDYEQLKSQDEQRLELAESARNDAVERVQYLQQECETLLEKTRVEMAEPTRPADEHVAQIALKMDQDYAQRLTAAQEQAKHDLADAKGELKAKEKELAAMLVENEELKTAEVNASRRIVELERNATKGLDDAYSYLVKELDNTKAEVAEKEAQLTTLMTEYDFVAFATRTELEKSEAERNAAVEETNKALQIVKYLEDASKSLTAKFEQMEKVNDVAVTQRLHEVEQNYTQLVGEERLQSERLLVNAREKLAENEEALAVLKAEFDSCKAKSQKQLKIINDARTTVFQTRKALDGKVEQIEQEKEMALALLKAEFDSCKAKSQKQVKIINDARTTAFQTKKELDGKVKQIEEIEEGRMKDAERLAQVEQDYIRLLAEVQTRSEETLAEARAALERKEHELAVLMSEYAEGSERDKTQLDLAIAALDAAIEANEKALYKVQELEQASSEALLAETSRKMEQQVQSMADARSESDKIFLADAIRTKDVELTVLASKCDDAPALHDEQLAASGKQVKLKEEEHDKTNEARYRQDDGTRLEVETAALQAEDTDTYSRYEQDISAANEEVDQKERELVALKGEYVSQEGLHTIEDVPAALKDSAETSPVLLMSEGQKTTDDQDVQKVDAIAAQSSPRYKIHVVHFLPERIKAHDFAYSFFLDYFDGIVFYVHMHCPLVESDVEVTGPSWVQESVREACQEPRAAVASFFQVVCMFGAFLMRRQLWRVVWHTIVMFYQVILLVSPRRFIGSESNTNDIKQSTFQVGRRLRGSPKKRAL